MRSHLRSVAKRKVSDFLLREEGMIGNRTGFATAALVSTTALAATLLVATDAGAHGVHPHACGGQDCPAQEKCCFDYFNGTGYYDCVPHGAGC